MLTRHTSLPTGRGHLASRWSGLFAVVLFAAACSDQAADLVVPHDAWPDGDLVAVAWSSETQVIVAASDGEIHHSKDAGTTWQRARVPAVAGLRGISMANAQSGWAVGPGVVLRTDDGARSWRRQRLPELESEMRLTAVHARDALRVSAVGEAGLTLETSDGGGVWKRGRRTDAREGQASPIHDLFCRPGADGPCWAVASTLYGRPEDDAPWSPVVIAGPLPVITLSFEPGRVEITSKQRRGLRQAIHSVANPAEIEWRIDVSVWASEVDSIAQQRDPTAVFELIEARLQEVRGLIEEVGTPPDLIQVRGEPPWDFEDVLDDDPAYLERYWRERTRDPALVRIETLVRPSLVSGAISMDGHGLIVGRAGALAQARQAGDSWQSTVRLGSNDLHDVAFGSARVVIVGAQGGLWTARPAGPRTWERPELAGGETFFESLRGIAFSPSGERGLVVGDGRLLRSLDGGASWSVLARADALGENGGPSNAGAVDTVAQDRDSHDR